MVGPGLTHVVVTPIVGLGHVLLHGFLVLEPNFVLFLHLIDLLLLLLHDLRQLELVVQVSPHPRVLGIS